MFRSLAGVIAILSTASIAVALAAEPGKPVGEISREQKRAFDLHKTATGGVMVRLYGEPIAEYVVDRGNKPFLWRVLGPTGTSMPQAFPMADVPGETTDRVHQRGLTFAHQGVNGFDTWAEDATYRDTELASRLDKVGAIRHRGYRTLAGGPMAVIHAHNQFIDGAWVDYHGPVEEAYASETPPPLQQ